MKTRRILTHLFPIVSLFYLMHAQAHVMVLGDVQDADIAHLEATLPQKTTTLPSLSDTSLSFQEARKSWIEFFSKNLLEERLSFRLGDSVQCLFFPMRESSTLNGCALISYEDEQATIETSLLELQQISLHGITEWELTKAKEQVWDHLYATSPELAESSTTLLQSISSADIQKFLSPLYMHVSDELDLFQESETSREEGSILVKLCSNTSGDISPFYSLGISDSDKKTIYWVIHTIAKSNAIKLGLKQSEVRKKGDKIEHVHPLRFLSYVMGEGSLRGDMQKIKSSSYKWSNFMDNYTSRLSREAANNNLLQYVPGFAHSLGVDVEVIRSFVIRHDWYGLVNFFL